MLRQMAVHGPNDKQVRQWAIGALALSGTPADVPLLSDIATNDPLTVRQTVPARDGKQDAASAAVFDPLRELAGNAVVQIQHRRAKAAGAPVAVGMAWQDAEPVLSRKGAMHVDVDGIKGTDTHILEVNTFPNGSLVVIEISTTTRRITALKVCVDPKQPASKLTWKSVTEFHPDID